MGRRKVRTVSKHFVTLKMPETTAKLLRVLASLASTTMQALAFEYLEPVLRRKLATYGVDAERWLGETPEATATIVPTISVTNTVVPPDIIAIDQETA